MDQYEKEFNFKTLDDSFYFESPGNLLRYTMILLDNNIDSLNDKLSCILNLSDNYKNNNNPFILTFISLLIEIFYNELSKKKIII